MSTRFGMADGRCFTLNMSNQLTQEDVAKGLGINPLDSGALRLKMQSLETMHIPPQTSPCGIINYGR
jgi:hypothetical protein